jgi:hypothetical protein
MRYGQPTRARDVLRHIAIVNLSGDPSPDFISRVQHVLTTPDSKGRYARIYADVARRVGWHEGGPGDLLRKALALVNERER